MGATGRVGSAVADLLVKTGLPVRALTHRSEAATKLPAGVDCVVGDLTAPESLDAALDGVGAVFLVWTAPPDTAAEVVERLARVPRIVFLSAPFRTPHPFFQQPNPMATMFAEIETLLASSAVELTVIRPGMFASNALSWWAPTIRAGRAVRWTYGEAQTAPVDEQDVAAVGVRALLSDGLVGGDYVLTGPEALSQAEQVRIIGDVLGRVVPFVDLPPEEFREEMAAWPPQALNMLLGAWGATMDVPALVTTTVTDILGVPARSFREWVSDNAMEFGSATAP